MGPRRTDRRRARALAAAALLAGVAIAVVALVAVLGSGGGGGSDGRSTGSAAGGKSGASSPSPAPLPSIAKVRNASPQPGWGPPPRAVPILRYDTVGIPDPAAAFPELTVPPADFRAQMGWLQEHGYEAVGLETVRAAWTGGGTLPAKPIVLSFDGVDGDLLRVAEPELSRRGWPGVLVLDADAPSPRPEDVARLLALGWDLEPSGRDPAAARSYVRTHFSTAARDFAFPPAGSAGPTPAAVREAGFAGATVTGPGFAEPSRPFAMPRISIFGLSKISGFVEALTSRGQGAGA
jgi:peptidoglycan/xylan/chitin deacetylase (PgdA/CDA1 family)